MRKFQVEQCVCNRKDIHTYIHTHTAEPKIIFFAMNDKIYIKSFMPIFRCSSFNGIARQTDTHKKKNQKDKQTEREKERYETENRFEYIMKKNIGILSLRKKNVTVLEFEPGYIDPDAGLLPTELIIINHREKIFWGVLPMFVLSI